MVDPSGALATDDGHLVGGGLLGDHVVDADHGPDRRGHVLPVAGHHDDSRMPARRRLRMVRAASGRIGSISTQRAGRHPVDADEHAHGPIEPASLPSPGHPRLVAVHADPARLADRHVVPADRAADARAGDALRCGSVGRGRARGRAPARTMAAARTWGDTWSSDAASRSTSLGSRSSAVTMSTQCGSAGREGAGLVEEQDLGVGQPFEWPTALHDDTATSGPRQTGDDGDRCGEDERAGRGDDQHGDGPRQLTGHRPRRSGDADAHDEEDEGVAIGQAHERRVGRRGLLDQPHDAGVGRVVGPCAGEQVEGTAGVDGAASHGLADGVARRATAHP